MKYLVDTCGWIESITAGKLNKKFEKYLSSTADVVVPTIVQFELYKWAIREQNEETAWNIIGVTEQCEVKTLDTGMALYAAEISQQFKLAMADAMIYAYSKKLKVELVTCDGHFAKLPNVIYFKK